MNRSDADETGRLESALVRLSAGGDDARDALGEIYDLMAARMLRAAFAVTGSHPDAEDALYVYGYKDRQTVSPIRLDPDTGRVLWRTDHRTSYTNILPMSVKPTDTGVVVFCRASGGSDGASGGSSVFFRRAVTAKKT